MSEFEQSVVIPLRETLVSKLGFSFDPADDPNGVFKGLRNENYFLVLYYSTEEEKIGLGFWHGNEKQFSSTQKKHFLKIFEQPEFNSDFSDFLDWGEQWMIKNLECIGWESNRIIEYILFRIQLLEFAVNLLEID
jgi:hypothetical protein